MPELYLARQPIFNRDLELYGYELLYRSGMVSNADFKNEDQATSQVLLNTVVDIGLERITAGNKAFINISKDFIDGSIEIPLEHANTVLEIPSHLEISYEVKEAIKQLALDGFTLALDNYDPDSGQKKLMELVDLVKIDIKDLSENEIKQLVDDIKAYDVKLIAKGVEQHEQIEELLTIGFDYLQGHFLSYPRITHEKRMPTNRLAVVQLLSKVLDPDIETASLESIIRSDVSLSYRLLRLANSAAYSKTEIESISHAIVYLGRDAIKTLATIIALTGVSDKPEELTNIALVRAKMCELLAEQVDPRKSGAYFTVGLLSTIDAILDQPINDIVEQLPLTQELKEALEFQSGDMGEALRCVRAYEECRMEDISYHDLVSSDLNSHYVGAIDWANEVAQSIMQAMH